MANVAVIIVNWNGLRHLEVCLNSTFQQTYKDFELFFVDNGSTDESVEFVKTNYAKVKVVECEENHGFAEGNNIGIREAFRNPDIKYIVCLNNDTEVKDDWLEKLVDVAEQDEQIGACASKLLFFDERNIIDSAGDFYYSGSLKVYPRGHGKPDQYTEQEECLSCCAAAALYRREALVETQLGDDFFDSEYFAYIEDTDLSLRLRLAGWKCVFVPTAVVYHKFSATTSQLKEGRKKFYSSKNRIFTLIKIYPLTLWAKAIKNPITDQKHGIGTIGTLILSMKLLANVALQLPALLKKRGLIRKNSGFGQDIFIDWQREFSRDR